MSVILEKKDFKLFFHNKELNKTLPVGWTNTVRGMLIKCKKLLQENEGSHFEYTFKDEVNFKIEKIALIKLIEKVYEEKPEINKTDELIKTELKKSKQIIPEAAKHIIPQQPESGYLFCSSKNCNHQIKIEDNLEYKQGTRIYLVCSECGHKTQVSKIKKTNSLSYAVGAENKGTLIRFDGPKHHMNKKARLRLKKREN